MNHRSNNHIVMKWIIIYQWVIPMSQQWWPPMVLALVSFYFHWRLKSLYLNKYFWISIPQLRNYSECIISSIKAVLMEVCLLFTFVYKWFNDFIYRTCLGALAYHFCQYQFLDFDWGRNFQASIIWSCIDLELISRNIRTPYRPN